MVIADKSPMRLHLAVLAILLAGCDESDPSTSQRCVDVRMKAIELSYWRTQNARSGNPTDHLDIALAKLRNENWQCFK